MRRYLSHAWSRLCAVLRALERFAFESFRSDDLAGESLPDDIKRDLGIRDGRGSGRGEFRQEKLLAATRLPQGPL